MASKSETRYVPANNKELESVVQDGKTIPIRAIYFQQVPSEMTPDSLKLALQEIYDGPVQTVILKSHRQQQLAGGSSHQSHQYAIVYFQHAATATAVLRQRANWPDGQLISAYPAQEQSDDSQITYTDQTRLRLLNDDCLLLLHDYLSLGDIVRLSESSSQMLDFAIENTVFKKRAREGHLSMSNTDISFELFDKTMRYMGPHLTTLVLSGLQLDLTQCTRSVLDNSPQLCRLRVTHMVQPNHSQAVHEFGLHCGKLKELCLSDCLLNEAEWLWSFIDRAHSLEVLALQDIDNIYGLYRVPAWSFKCPKLHTLSMRPLLENVVHAHRATLRHLFFDFERRIKSRIRVALPDLESIMVVPEMANTNVGDQLDKMRNLRKIIVRYGNKHSSGWLKMLANGPNVVQHLVLLETNLSPAVCNIVGRFGAKLHTLVLHRVTAYARQTLNAKLQQLGAKLTHLRTLRIHEGYGVVDHLLPAVVQASAELETIAFGGVWLDSDFMPATLAALRTASTAAAATASSAADNAAGAVNKRRVFLDLTEEIKTPCRALLKANADIVSWNERTISDRYAPSEEYIYYPTFDPFFS